jgi:hypothetical protein
VKCIFTQLSGLTAVDPVVIADPLDTSNLVPARSQNLTDPSCFQGELGTVRTPAD